MKMAKVRDDILLTAINGLENKDYKAALEKIMMLATLSDKQTAYKKGFELSSKARDLVTIEDINLKYYKAKYGYLNKYPVIQLTLDYIQMPSQFFLEIYRFEYIPKEVVLKEVGELIQSIQFKRKLSSIYGGQMDATLNLFKSLYA